MQVASTRISGHERTYLDRNKGPAPGSWSRRAKFRKPLLSEPRPWSLAVITLALSAKLRNLCDDR